MTSWTSLPTEEAFITLRALGRVALTALSKARVAKLEGIVKEQRRTSEDFKDQMGILVSKLLERDSSVRQSFETVEKQLNRHHFALNKAEDQVCLQVLQRSAMSS